jgi:predicted  nucleic acid-binding Zn-ribbon protein
LDEDGRPRKTLDRAEDEAMSAQPSEDVRALHIELEHLEHREQEVSALRRKLHDRLDSFPNEVTGAREQLLSAERQQLHLRIDALRAELRLLGEEI